MDQIQMELLKQVADLHEVPQGAYNFRVNGKGEARNTTEHIDIVTKTDKQGIDIVIKPGTKNESVHIPVVLSQSGITDMVYNDFYIGEDADVTIVAGGGMPIHSSDLNRIHLKVTPLGKFDNGLRVEHALPQTVAGAIMLLNIFHLRIFPDIKGMDSIVL